MTRICAASRSSGPRREAHPQARFSRAARPAARSARPAPTSSSTGSPGSSPDRGAAGPLPPEQHVLDGVQTVTDNDVEVMRAAAPSRGRHGAACASSARISPDARGTLEARARRPRAPLRADARRPRHRPSRGDCRTSSGSCRRRGAQHRAVRPARAQGGAARRGRFTSDPDATLLEENDVAVLLRSDHLDHIADGAKSLFDELELVRRHVDSQGLRRRRLRRRPEPAEGDGRRPQAFPAPS